MTKEVIEKYLKQYLAIKRLGYIKNIRDDNIGVNSSFMSYIKKDKNDGVGIRVRRCYSKASIMLFYLNFTEGNCNILEKVRDIYGNNYKNNFLKYLQVDVWADNYSDNGIYKFKIVVNRVEKRIYFYIYNYSKRIVFNRLYWDFSIIEKAISEKISYLLIVKAFSKVIDGSEYFKYCNIDVYRFKDFELFLRLVESGIIGVRIKLGRKISNNSLSKNISFFMKNSDLNKLFAIYK